jgi:hypothetical protein
MKKYYEKFKRFLILAMRAAKSDKAYTLHFKYRIVKRIIISKDKVFRVFKGIKPPKKEINVFL